MLAAFNVVVDTDAEDVTLADTRAQVIEALASAGLWYHVSFGEPV
jgi:hypothetical protein